MKKRLVYDHRYDFLIYPTPDQKEMIQYNYGCAKFMFNRSIDYQILNYEVSKLPSKYYSETKEWFKTLLIDEIYPNLLKAYFYAMLYAVKEAAIQFRLFIEPYFKHGKMVEPETFEKKRKEWVRKKDYPPHYVILCTKSKYGKNRIYDYTDNCILLPELGNMYGNINKKIEGHVNEYEVSKGVYGYYLTLYCTDPSRWKKVQKVKKEVNQ